MVVASVSALGYFVPIFAFLLVFIVVYALLAKTGIFGRSHAAMLFVSFILAAFFIVQVSLVEFVKFSNVWFGVLIIGLFFLLVVLAFLPGKEPLGFLTKSNWFSWVAIMAIILLFIGSAAYAFNWMFSWDFRMDIVGIVLFLIVAAIVSWKIKS